MNGALRTPSKATLRKYGLSLEEWETMAQAQSRVCYVCAQVPKSGILHIDHEHVRGWKKMSPTERKQFVRGCLCWRCNASFLRRGMTAERAERIASYLKAYELRKVTKKGLV